MALLTLHHTISTALQLAVGSTIIHQMCPMPFSIDRSFSYTLYYHISVLVKLIALQFHAAQRQKLLSLSFYATEQVSQILT